MSVAATTFAGKAPAPASKPAEAPKPAEPAKEKPILLIEKLVKDSEASEEDKKTCVERLTRTYTEIKAEKKPTARLLHTFMIQLGGLDSLPADDVKVSVHARIVKRGDAGENKPLPDSGPVAL